MNARDESYKALSDQDPQGKAPSNDSASKAEPAFRIRQGYFLPHWTLEGAIYHVVFRLRDSVPQQILLAFQQERQWRMASDDYSSLSARDRRQIEQLVTRKVDQYLDAGYGECLLRFPGVADIIQRSFLHFHGARYALHAWAVMPNHVHTVVEPYSGWELQEVTHSWKSYSAHMISRLVARTGPIWHKESYDHIIRNEAAYHRIVEYVLDNPRRAGLRDWKWVGSHARGSQRRTILAAPTVSASVQRDAERLP